MKSRGYNMYMMNFATCPNCEYELNGYEKFCPSCGVKLDPIVPLSKVIQGGHPQIDRLDDAIKNNKNELWKVTTQGDCEGYTTRDLGIFRGSILNIAKYLSDKAVFSSLDFEPVKIKNINESDVKSKSSHSISIRMPYFNSSHMSFEDYFATWQYLLKNPNVTIDVSRSSLSDLELTFK
jgi:hypothetical protein